jgi:hypothetical protein
VHRPKFKSQASLNPKPFQGRFISLSTLVFPELSTKMLTTSLSMMYGECQGLDLTVSKKERFLKYQESKRVAEAHHEAVLNVFLDCTCRQ